MTVTIYWFRRDLRLEDNLALSHALKSGFPVLPIFIFDDNILDELSEDDPRITFIYESLEKIDIKLRKYGSCIKIFKGNPLQAWKDLMDEYDIKKVYFNHDYEPYAKERDNQLTELLTAKGIESHSFKDQVIFEKNEVLKSDGKPYSIFTHYKRKWLSQFKKELVDQQEAPDLNLFFKYHISFPSLEELHFTESAIKVRPYNLSILGNYVFGRDVPSEDSTSYLGPHLRFGTISIRMVIRQLRLKDDIFLSELIWREFFMQILYHFPRVVDQNCRAKYDNIVWLNKEEEFEKWCQGKTGYPFIDAGMRQLKQTGYMHNRVRMATASFLIKHLLIDWRWGEAYFAQKLLDYELSSNNGNWQWAAGTGCDAAPYFRVFNPITQLLKFDKEMLYVRKWIPEIETPEYPEPIIEHAAARARALETYKTGIKLK